ncbi:unnamed protein product [Lactuca saligna]|uniref:Uncharacterized protein n=1 Tax=Lactuca saligna TaxID=75948 RepID=A0AA35YIS5_LACSI|nr:unnamed protein product [Lactuca saligna]
MKIKKVDHKTISPTSSDHESSQSYTLSEVPMQGGFSIPSPTSTFSTPITIAPCPPVSLSVSQSQTPFFTDSTATTITTTDEPPVNVNTSDAGARASGFSVGHSTPPVSTLRRDDPETIFGGDVNFEDFTFSPFHVVEESDEDATVTQKQFKAINDKLDSLIQSSNSSSNNAYSQEVVKALNETTLKEHAANLENANKAMEDSAKTCKEATDKVNKLIS